MNFSRRKFLQQSIAGTVALSSIPAIVSSSISPEKSGQQKYRLFKKNDTLLFQGDSITDAGREKEKELPNYPRSFGSGYAFIAASHLLHELPEKNLVLYNRGISGNKIYQLAERWQKDCLQLKPDVLSILIGINDYWHARNGNYEGTVEIYKTDYWGLLNRTKKHLPGVQLIICEPFAVPGTSAVDESWMDPVKKYRKAAKMMADEFNAIWIPFQKVFDEAIKYAPAKYWTNDGVHPSMAGAQLMAEAWLRAVE